VKNFNIELKPLAENWKHNIMTPGLILLEIVFFIPVLCWSMAKARKQVHPVICLQKWFAPKSPGWENGWWILVVKACLRNERSVSYDVYP
jgi:hypothetical protein